MSRYRKERNFLVKQVLNSPINQKTYVKNIFPRYLGIIFIGDVSTSILKKLKFQIEFVFKSFFFDIIFIGKNKLDSQMKTLYIKEEFDFLNSNLTKVRIFPTNYFYSTLISLISDKNVSIGLGLTNIPIYSSSDESLLFLFGEANLTHNCAIVSTHNLMDFNKPKLVENRIIKEAIHEIGHLILGLDHCFSSNCVMRFSSNVNEIDKKSNRLCKNCRTELEKIRTRQNF